MSQKLKLLAAAVILAASYGLATTPAQAQPATFDICSITCTAGPNYPPGCSVTSSCSDNPDGSSDGSCSWHCPAPE